MRIVELLIDEIDNISGFDAVALVNSPAHEAGFHAFNNQDIEDAIAFQVIKTAVLELIETEEGVSEEFSHYEDLPIDVQDKLLERLASVGISMETLAKEGYEIIEEEEFKRSQEFSVNRTDAKPDLTTNQTRGGYKILYSYKVKPGEGPSIQNNSRDFCIDLIGLNLLFRKEDIDRLTIKGANSEEFGYYDIFKYKGSFNCRHEWKEVYVKQKAETVEGTSGVDISSLLKNLGVGAGQGEETTKPGNLRGIGTDSPMVSFSKENFSFQEDQQVVIGPLMLPNKLIFRVDENDEPYFVYFSEDTIRQIAGKMMKNKLLDKVNMEHDPDSPVDGYMLESWIIEDPLKDKQAAYGMSYPKGTWMGMYKIEDTEVWKGVKEGRFTGYSIEGFFADRLVQN